MENQIRAGLQQPIFYGRIRDENSYSNCLIANFADSNLVRLRRSTVTYSNARHPGHGNGSSAGLPGFRADGHAGAHLHALSDSYTVPDADHGADGYPVSHRHAAAHLYAIPNCHTYPDTYSHANPNSGAYCNANPNPNRDTHTLANTDSYPNSGAYCNANPNRDTHTLANTDSYPNGAVSNL